MRISGGKLIFGRRRALAKARHAFELGELARAKAICVELLEGNRSAPSEAIHLLGKTLLKLGELDQAQHILTTAVQSNERDAIAHNLLGMVLRDKGNRAGAESHLRQALRLKARFADAHINLGAVLNEQGRAGEADECFRAALAAEPENAVAWCNLGLVLSEQGSPKQADECFRSALRAEPGYFYARVAFVMNKLQEVYDDEADILRSRAEYQRALEELKNWLPAESPGIAAAADTVGWVTPFFLAYQGKNDRDLQRIYGRLVCDLMARRYPDLTVPLPAGRLGTDRPLRVGIATGFFFDHSVWKNPIRGWIENLDRSRFEIFGYYTGHRQDAQTLAARNACTQFVEGLPFEALAQRIRGDALDALIFPEIGMDAVTAKLAALRLSPVQCTSWGHPTTSGMPTIDYFLSSELMEPADGDEHYTERLIRLPNLSVHYTPPAYPARSLERNDLGLRTRAAVFFCAQSLFKYLPQHDVLFPRIAKQVDDCQFVFIASQRSAALTDRFRSRIARAFELVGLDPARHLVMLPRMDGSTFQAVARLSDIFLDNIGWSGCNSALESMACGVPAVTCPGSTMRGRHTHAFLKAMGLDELIAPDMPSYIDLAARLARDATWREAVRGRMRERLPRLFGDMACVRALEAFLTRAANR